MTERLSEREKMYKKIEELGDDNFNVEAVLNWHLAEVKRMQDEINLLKEKAWKYDELCK